MQIENRPEQTKVVEEICKAFKSGKNTVVLSAPTGWGKSILAWRVAHELSMSVAVLSHQKVLQDQYNDTFWDGIPSEFCTLKGKGNYRCLEKHTVAALAPCAFSQSYDCPKFMQCPYNKAKKNAEITDFLNTNYQYVWSMAEYSDNFKLNKDLYVYDEAHTIHSLYTDFRSPEVTHKDVELYRKQLELAGSEPGTEELEIWARKLITEIQTIDFDLAEDEEYLRDKFKAIFELKRQNGFALSRYLDEYCQSLCESGKIKIVGALDKIECRNTTAMNVVLGDRPNFEECVLELNKGEDEEFSFKMTPFNIGKLFAEESNLFAPNRLFMSATLIDPEGFLTRLGYDPKDAHIIELDSKFPVENRPIYVAPKSNIRLNYDTIKKGQEAIQPFLEITKSICEEYISKNQSGVVFTSSYELTNMVANYLRMNLKNATVLFNLDTSERESVLENFKTPTTEPKVLVSCSFFEGINLNDDLSRFNIIFKLPYRSLASKYVKTVREDDPLLYATWTLNDVVQAAGRSVRSETDWADTYILDPAIYGMLYYNKKLFPKWFKKAISYL